MSSRSSQITRFNLQARLAMARPRQHQNAAPVPAKPSVAKYTSHVVVPIVVSKASLKPSPVLTPKASLNPSPVPTPKASLNPSPTIVAVRPEVPVKTSPAVVMSSSAVPPVLTPKVSSKPSPPLEVPVKTSPAVVTSPTSAVPPALETAFGYTLDNTRMTLIGTDVRVDAQDVNVANIVPPSVASVPAILTNTGSQQLSLVIGHQKAILKTGGAIQLTPLPLFQRWSVAAIPNTPAVTMCL